MFRVYVQFITGMSRRPSLSVSPSLYLSLSSHTGEPAEAGGAAGVGYLVDGSVGLWH